MKAMLIAPDRSLHWSEVPNPVLKPGDLLIRTVCVGVNRADIMQRAGQYPPPPGAPEWMGLEVSGIIEKMTPEAAACGRLSVGQSVCALMPGGAYAEYAAVPEGLVCPIPEGLSMVEAAALPEAFATSWLNLFCEAGLQPGDTALISAGSSGLSGAAIQLCHQRGLRVITTVRRSDAVDYCRSLGADVVVNTREERLAEVLAREKADGHPVNGVMDCLAGKDVGECLPYLARGASWVIIASLAGSETTVDLTALYKCGVRLCGSTLRPRPEALKAEILRSLEREVWPLLSARKIVPQICGIFPMPQAEDAHAVLERGGHHGKVILTL